MTSAICLLAWIVCLLLVPAMVIAWFLESDQERICRLHRSGMSQRALAEKFQVSRYRIRQVLATA